MTNEGPRDYNGSYEEGERPVFELPVGSLLEDEFTDNVRGSYGERTPDIMPDSRVQNLKPEQTVADDET